MGQLHFNSKESPKLSYSHPGTFSKVSHSSIVENSAVGYFQLKDGSRILFEGGDITNVKHQIILEGPKGQVSGVEIEDIIFVDGNSLLRFSQTEISTLWSSKFFVDRSRCNR